MSWLVSKGCSLKKEQCGNGHPLFSDTGNNLKLGRSPGRTCAPALQRESAQNTNYGSRARGQSSELAGARKVPPKPSGLGSRFGIQSCSVSRKRTVILRR